MTFKKPSRNDLLSACGEIGPDDGIDPRTQSRHESRKVPNRKALQLCGQVAQTLAHVLAWECGDERLQGLIVESVRPAPNSARLLVTIRFGDARPVISPAEVLAQLAQASGMLRSEVVAAIHRRKAPELTFRILVADEEGPSS
jgi:ribosome-binding factor A